MLQKLRLSLDIRRRHFSACPARFGKWSGGGFRQRPHPSVMRYQAALRPDRRIPSGRESGASRAMSIAWQGGPRRDRRPATSCAWGITGAQKKKSFPIP
jgi:hypothetical protein